MSQPDFCSTELKYDSFAGQFEATLIETFGLSLSEGPFLKETCLSPLFEILKKKGPLASGTLEAYGFIEDEVCTTLKKQGLLELDSMEKDSENGLTSAPLIAKYISYLAFENLKTQSNNNFDLFLKSFVDGKCIISASLADFDEQQNPFEFAVLDEFNRCLDAQLALEVLERSGFIPNFVDFDLLEKRYLGREVSLMGLRKRNQHKELNLAQATEKEPNCNSAMYLFEKVLDWGLDSKSFASIWTSLVVTLRRVYPKVALHDRELQTEIESKFKDIKHAVALANPDYVKLQERILKRNLNRSLFREQAISLVQQLNHPNVTIWCATDNDQDTNEAKTFLSEFLFNVNSKLKL